MKNLITDHRLILTSGITLLFLRFIFQFWDFINGIFTLGLPSEPFPIFNFATFILALSLFPLALIFILTKKMLGWIISNSLFISAIAIALERLISGIWFLTSDAPENPIEWITINELLYFIFDLLTLPVITLALYGFLLIFINKTRIRTNYKINRFYQIVTIAFSILTIIFLINNIG